MYELKHIKGNTYYIACPTNIGIYNDNGEIYLIDSGSDESVARKIMQIINQNNWHLKLIINTHYHADHIGGNAYLIKKTNCQVYIPPCEQIYLFNNELEANLLSGGIPFKNNLNKFLKAEITPRENIVSQIPEFLEKIDLCGHTEGMIGIKTPDNVLFVADSLNSKELINKYHINYIYDLTNYLATLEKLSNIKCDYYLLAHGTLETDLLDLIKVNSQNVLTNTKLIVELLTTPLTITELLKKICDNYQIQLNATQYLLLMSTLKAYLKYLIDKNLLKIEYQNNYQYIMINE